MDSTTTSPWLIFFQKAQFSELGCVQGACRLHLPLREWLPICGTFGKNDVDTFLQRVKPEITFRSEDVEVTAKIPIIPGTQVRIFERNGVHGLEYVIKMKIEFEDAFLTVSIVTGMEHPGNEVLGNFIAIYMKKN